MWVKVKVIACSDGTEQRAYITKEEAAAPTVCLNGVITI